MPRQSSPTPDLLLALKGERIEELVRERIDAALPMDEVRSLRRELLLLVACISSEEAAILLGCTPKVFRTRAESRGLPLVNIGHRTPRYRLLAVDAMLEQLSEGSREDIAVIRRRLDSLAAAMMKRLMALEEGAPLTVIAAERGEPRDKRGQSIFSNTNREEPTRSKTGR